MKFHVVLLVCVLSLFAVRSAGADTGTVTGRLLLSGGKPLSNGQVFFFDADSPLDKPVVGKFWRVPDATAHVDEHGRFSIELESGSYYMAAIKRSTAEKLGPPQVGDHFLPSHTSRGIYRLIKVQKDSTTNIGTIQGIQRFKKIDSTFKGKATVIEGRIATDSGQAVPNLYVLAYTDSSMRGRPLFVSSASDAEGHYRLLVDKGRVYYLKSREIFVGGKPQEGSPVGVFGSYDEPTPVEIKTSSTTSGIDIVVNAFASGKQ